MNFGRMKWRLAAVTAALLGGSTLSANAQDNRALHYTAMSLAAYESSKDYCFYEPVVGETLHGMADRCAQSHPYRWQQIRREAGANSQAMSTLAHILGGSRLAEQGSDCDAPANTISLGLQFGMFLVPPSPELQEAIQRLSRGGQEL